MALPSEQAHAVEKLKSLFLLLDPNVSSLSEAETEKRNELLQRVEYFLMSSRKLADYYRLKHPDGIKCKFTEIIPRFMQLLRESVLTHQWSEALKIVQTICYEVTGVNSAIWKVGLACLFQDCEKNSRLVEQFVKKTCVLESLTVVEVLLDYLLFLLTQSQTAEAEQLIQELKKNTMYASNLSNGKRIMAQKLFVAYQGLAFYAEWKLAVFKVSQEEGEDVYCDGGQADEISRLMNHGVNTETAKIIAKNAVEYLGTVKDIPGVWDIFVTRLVEIHEYYGEVEDACNILESYRERNPGNPNAHRYLYAFESRYGGDEFVLIQCLQDIIQLDPCNPLCLALYRLKEKHDSGAVSLLFDYLDYTHCNDNEEVWQLLADRLRNANSHNLDDVLKQCWETRRDWWPNVIFKDLDSGNSSELSTISRNKQLVQEVLLNLDEPLKKKRVVHCSEFASLPASKRRKIQNPY